MAVDLSFGGSSFPRSQEVREQLYESGQGGMSSRYRRLERYEAWHRCLEYAHQEYDWSGFRADTLETISANAVVPYGFSQPMKQAIENVRQKRPTAPLRLCPLIVDRFTGLLFSKERTPAPLVEGDPQSEDFLQAVHRQARFWPTMYSARTFGGAMGSSLVTTHLADGLFAYHAHNPKGVADIIWEDADRTTVAGVLIQYPTVQEFEEIDPKSNRPTGRFVERQLLYRRIIDAEWDVVFKPAPIVDGRLPLLEIDDKLSVQHGLGFFPGVWIQNLPNESEVDGLPDCEGVYQMLDTIDRLLSQANRGLLANMDPTLVMSLDPKIAARMGGGAVRKGSDNALDVGPGGNAHYLEMSAAGIQAGVEFAKMLRQAALDRAQCVLVDPEKISGAAQSARAIELIYAPMLEKAGRLREQYGIAVEKLSDMTLRIARAFSDPARYPGNAVPKFRLPPRIEERDADAADPDVEPIRTRVERAPGEPGGVVTLRWGPYFPPTPSDAAQTVATTVNAVSGNLIDQETGTMLVAPMFGLTDTAGLIRKVREEQVEKEKRLLEQMGYGEPGGSALDEQLVEAEPAEAEQPASTEVAAALPDETAPADTVLNGAQISQAIDIVTKVAAEEFPRETGIAMLVEFFNLRQQRAEAIMGEVGRNFVRPPPPSPPPRGGAGIPGAFGKKAGEAATPAPSEEPAGPLAATPEAPQ